MMRRWSNSKLRELMPRFERTPEEDAALLASLRLYLQESGRVLARSEFLLHLKTACGCTRMVQWQGRPPEVFEAPLRNPVVWVEPGPVTAAPKFAARRFELVRPPDEEHSIALYEEIL